ncbi:hypothetical protein X801_05693, partial [Opisthorchis viverrini]
VLLGGVTLCDENCEVSFEFGLVNAHFPEVYSNIIPLIWNADFHQSLNTFVLEPTKMAVYGSLNITIGGLAFIWPTSEHAYYHDTPTGRVLLSSIRFHEGKYFALGSDFLHRFILRLKHGSHRRLHIAKNP